MLVVLTYPLLAKYWRSVHVEDGARCRLCVVLATFVIRLTNIPRRSRYVNVDLTHGTNGTEIVVATINGGRGYPQCCEMAGGKLRESIVTTPEQVHGSGGIVQICKCCYVGCVLSGCGVRIGMPHTCGIQRWVGNTKAVTAIGVDGRSCRCLIEGGKTYNRVHAIDARPVFGKLIVPERLGLAVQEVCSHAAYGKDVVEIPRVAKVDAVDG